MSAIHALALHVMLAACGGAAAMQMPSPPATGRGVLRISRAADGGMR